MCAPATPTKIELLDRGVVPMVGGGRGKGKGGHANGSSRAQNVRVVHVGVLLANVRRCGSDGKPISEDASNGAT